jgi:TrmH family RNA methyltransferase
MAGRIRPLDAFFCEELFTTDTAPRILTHLVAAGASAIAVSERVLETLSDRELSQGLVVTFAVDSLFHTLNDLIAPWNQGPRLLVVLDRPQYPGNVGTLIRTADAVGADGVVLIEPAVDPFAPKSVRAAMGSIFAIPIVTMADVSALEPWGNATGIQWVGADASEGSIVWEGDAMSGSIGLVLGNEGEGLQQDLVRLVNRTVRLPQRGGAESLNVSIAGGILMYEWVRINRPDLY